MAVTTRSSDIAVYNKNRILCEDVFEGEDAVHAKGATYLPRLEQQDDDQYNAMVLRARFYNAFGVTVHGMLGMVFRKDPVLDTSEGRVADDALEIISNVDLEGTGLIEYSKNVLKQLIITGCCGTLVDVPEVELQQTGEDGEPLPISKLQAERLNIRPYLTMYTHDDIIRLKYDKIKNIKVLTRVVLREQYDNDADEFGEDFKYRYRVLRLSPDGVYTQQLYDEGGVEINTEITPKSLTPLNSIPFFLHGDIYAIPPLYDLAKTNLHHYFVKADHMHALHYIGLPTPCRSGVPANIPGTTKGMTKALGPGQIWEFENVNAKAWYLEMEGKGLEYIENELGKIEEHMAFLGASAIAPDSDVEETATKTKTKNASETSKLSSLADIVSQTCTEALAKALEWAGISQQVEIKISKDYMPDSMTPQKLLALVSSWQQGAFSKRTLHKNLQKGEIQDADRTFEDEEAEIKQDRLDTTPVVTGEE